jgi:hypothetical protein
MVSKSLIDYGKVLLCLVVSAERVYHVRSTSPHTVPIY